MPFKVIEELPINKGDTDRFELLNGECMNTISNVQIVLKIGLENTKSLSRINRYISDLNTLFYFKHSNRPRINFNPILFYCIFT